MSPLIRAEHLRALLADDPSDTDLVLLDVRWYLPDPTRGRSEYQQSHLPGAVFVDLESDLTGDLRPDRRGGRHPLPDTVGLQQAMRRAGVNEDSQVVVYDQGSSLAAARLWWLLRDAGQADVRVLDGGLRAWIAAGGEVTDRVPQPHLGDVVLRSGQLPQLDAEGVTAAIAAGRSVVDVRAADRYRGENEAIDPVAGHIPGSVSKPVTEVATADGFASPDQIRAYFAGLGPGDAFSCGSGVTASLALLAAESAGLTGLSIYPGSWSDWISDPTRPVATGPNPDA
ncbi:sulfurtransferase [Aestuariimicrobium kwangyangense]|uniref:sulfurtransferase n=1 Tax=Aestuariimicrobium kwangyangense TaxID=396389 RepID=UPI0003B706C2|nr:sulfurtransferase [Aestuariimicrobium kwangyangense]